MSVAVHLEFTPNPDTLKYAVSKPLLERGALDFTRAEDASDSPLAQRLFAIEGVDAVMIGRDFVTVTVRDQKRMMDVNRGVMEGLQAHLENDEPVYTGSQDDAHGTDESDVARRVIAILDEQVRPAVAMDGGDILFDRFEDGVVYLHLRGSCAGCPSSLATLKQGVEMRLRQMVPEVLEVRAS